MTSREPCTFCLDSLFKAISRDIWEYQDFTALQCAADVSTCCAIFTVTATLPVLNSQLPPAPEHISRECIPRYMSITSMTLKRSLFLQFSCVSKIERYARRHCQNVSRIVDLGWRPIILACQKASASCRKYTCFYLSKFMWIGSDHYKMFCSSFENYFYRHSYNNCVPYLSLSLSVCFELPWEFRLALTL